MVLTGFESGLEFVRRLKSSLAHAVGDGFGGRRSRMRGHCGSELRRTVYTPLSTAGNERHAAPASRGA